MRAPFVALVPIPPFFLFSFIQQNSSLLISLLYARENRSNNFGTLNTNATRVERSCVCFSGPFLSNENVRFFEGFSTNERTVEGTDFLSLLVDLADVFRYPVEKNGERYYTSFEGRKTRRGKTQTIVYRGK